jgi:predicted transcriptional regulator
MVYEMRRNDLDICADILKVARNGAKKTHLVYKANLNFNIIRKYIQRLKENGLLEIHNGRYFTTDKGFEFLDQFQDLMAPLQENPISSGIEGE